MHMKVNLVCDYRVSIIIEEIDVYKLNYRSRAYEDIFPILLTILTRKKSRKKRNNANQHTSDESTIYDPYFCTGRAATLLDGVFQRHTREKVPIRIFHEKRDFYRDMVCNWTYLTI